MALPAGVLASTVTFGPYTDAAGAVALVGLRGVLRPSSPVVHVPSGQVLIPAEVPIVIGEDGTASVGPIPRAGQAALLPVDFTYTVDWSGSSYSPTPGRRTFQLPVDSPATVDFDLLALAPAGSGVGVLVPSVVSVAGRAGSVTLTTDDLADATTVGKAVARAASQAAARSAIGAGTSSFSGDAGDLSGTIGDARVPASITRDTEVDHLAAMAIANPATELGVAGRAAFVPSDRLVIGPTRPTNPPIGTVYIVTPA